MKYEWIESSKELPPCDGSYEITNTPLWENDKDWTQRHPIATSYYDGYGFSYGGIYREPSFWRKYEPIEKGMERLGIEKQI